MIGELLQATATSVSRVLAELAPKFYADWKRARRDERSPKDVGRLGKALLQRLELSEPARRKLEEAQFVRVGGTGRALGDLIQKARPSGATKRSYSMLAVCGKKGDFATHYYEKNFANCLLVKRVFSYEAIRDEIVNKRQRFALKGLNMHLDRVGEDDCRVEVLLLKEERFLHDIGGVPTLPLSFGVAILLDKLGSPVGAVVHWELAAKALENLVSIEGIVVDEDQSEVLGELLKLHENVTRSDFVLSTTRDGQHEEIIAARDRLEELWNGTFEEVGGTEDGEEEDGGTDEGGTG